MFNLAPEYRQVKQFVSFHHFDTCWKSELIDKVSVCVEVIGFYLSIIKKVTFISINGF